MKTNKLMLAAMLFGAVALVSCDKEKENNDVVPPTPTPDPEVTVPDLDPTEGKITLAIHFVAAPCNDVILAGSFAEGAWDGTSLKMEAIKDFDGWYKAVITPIEANESGYTCEAKPVQLQSDGSFSWDGQWYGDGTNLVKILDGAGCELDYNESNGESQLKFLADAAGQVITAEAYGWKVNPCVELPVAEEAYIKHASAEEAENWVAEKMDKVSEGTFTHTFVYSDNGVNIGIDESCTGWYPADEIEGLDATTMAGQKITVTFVSTSGTKGTLSAKLAE